jgi:hypothetical protein
MNEDSMVELHVRLLGEGTDFSRPTKAINTGNEYQAEEIVADVIVESPFEIRHGHLLLHLALATNFLVLAVVKRVPSEMVNGTIRLRLCSFLLEFVAKSLHARGVFGRKNFGRKVAHLVNLTDFDFGAAIEGSALEPFHRLFH